MDFFSTNLFNWYGLAFAIGFWIGYTIVSRMWKNEKLPPAWIDSLLIRHRLLPRYVCPAGLL